MAIRDEESGPSKALEHAYILEGEDPISLPNKFVHFSNFVGMLVMGFKKEISSLKRIWSQEKGMGLRSQVEKGIISRHLVLRGNHVNLSA